MSETPAAPQTIHDLVRHLADTLVQNEVMTPMESIGWQEGQPPPPAVGQPDTGGAPPAEAKPEAAAASAGTTPAPAAPKAEPAKADAPQSGLLAEIESLRDPATGKILGKYDSAMEAFKGVGHAVKMAKQSFSERDAARQEAARLQAELDKARQPQPAAPAASPSLRSDPLSRATVEKAQAAYDAVLSKVVESGGILDAEAAANLSKAQRELARAEARAAAEESLLERDSASGAEKAKWDAVNAFMEKNHPESIKFADEIGLYVQSEPQINEAISALVAAGKEQSAAVLAWQSFDTARRAGTVEASLAAAQQTEVKLQAADQVRKEAVDQARKDAGIPGTSVSGVHSSGPAAPDRSEIDAAAEAMRAYGTTPGNPAAARWRELTIGRTLPSELFGS